MNPWLTVVLDKEPKNTCELLYDVLGDIGEVTDEKLGFHITFVASGPQFRFTVYIQLIKTGYQHLFLQIQSNTVEISFPLSIVTPEGESYLANNLEELTKAVHEIIARPRTKEMVEHLLKNSSRHKK